MRSRWILGFWMAAVPLVSAWAAAVPIAAPKADWFQWRGPKRDGLCQETGLLTRWPSDGPPLLWKQKTVGGGYSSVAITGGKIFGMGQQKPDDEVVWCLNESDGKTVWSTKIAGKGRGGYNEGPRCTPTVDGSRVYAVGFSGDLVCLNAATGKVVWSKNFGKDFKGRMMSGWGYSESPLIDGDHILCTPGGDDAAVVALDKATGRTVWTAKVPGGGGAGYASLMPAEVGGIRMVITWLKKKVVGVNARDGKLLWEYEKIANGTANIPTVVVRDNLVFCSSGYSEGGTALVKLEPDGSGVKATEVYHFGATKLQNHHGGMVLVGDHVYFGHGHNKGFPVCVELTTGKIAWKEDSPPGRGSAAVLYADGHLIYRWQDGVIALVEATPSGYRLKSSFKQPERSSANAWAHPVIAQGRLYIRDQDLLLCYDVKAKN